MQGGNKVLKGLGDKLTEQDKGGIKWFHRGVYQDPSFWLHTCDCRKAPCWDPRGQQLPARLSPQLPHQAGTYRLLLTLQLCAGHRVVISASVALLTLEDPHSFRYDSSNKYLLSTYCLPGAIVVIGIQ